MIYIIFNLGKFYRGNNKLTPNQKKKSSFIFYLEHNFENKVRELRWNEFCETRTVHRGYYYSTTLEIVAIRSDQRAKSVKFCGQWSHYNLIRGQSLGNGLDNGRNRVWSEGKVWETFWTMIALGSDQKAKSHYSLIKGRTKVWTMVALRSDQRDTKIWTLVAHKFDHRALIDCIHLFDCSFLSLFQMTKSCRHFKASFCVYFFIN